MPPRLLPSPRSMRRAAVVAVTGAGVILLGPGVAGAHIAPEPAAVEAGATATVGFVVEHGCEGSPTVELEFQVPAGLAGVAPVAKDGWTASTEGRTVTFTGGSLDTATSGTFAIQFTAPSEPGPISFPVVQRCAQGETAWIEMPADGAPEPERPAPVVLVTEGPPTSDDLAAGGHDEATGDGSHHEGEGEEESGSRAGLVAAGVGAVAIVGGTAVLVRRRRDTTG